MYKEREEQQKKYWNSTNLFCKWGNSERENSKFFLIHFLQDFPAQKVLYPIMLFCMNSTIYIYFIFLNSTHICVQVSTKFIDFGTLEIWGRIVNNALFRNKEIYAWWNVPAKLFKISLILLGIRNSGIFKYIGLFSISWFYTFVVL